MGVGLFEEMGWFRDLMEVKQSPKELMALFESLESGSSFSEDAKPYCFGLLIEECAKRVPNGQILALIHYLKTSKAAFKFRELDPTEAALIKTFSLMVRRLVDLSPRSQECLEGCFRLIEELGLSEARTQSYDFLFDQGISEAEMDVICDALHGRLAA